MPTITARLLPLSYLLVATFPSCAQDEPFSTPTFDRIDLQANKLIFKGDSTTFTAFHERLDELLLHGKGNIDVLHVGGSHVQADMWSAQLRHRLQTMVPGVRGGRGFVFPYNMAKSNNPYWYNPEFTGTWTSAKNVVRSDSSSLGLSGYAVTTRDSLTTLRITFRGTQYPGYVSDRVRIYHRMDSSFAVNAFTSDPAVLITCTPRQAEGFTEFRFSRPLDTLQFRFTKEDPAQKRFTLYGIDLRNGDPGITLSAVGVNGASTGSWVRCDRFVQELATLPPHLVILSIGINDAHDTDFDAKAFERNYDELIRRIKATSPNAAIVLTTNNDSYIRRKVNNRNATAVRASMLRLSATHGVAVWDLFTVMGGAGSMRHWQAAGLAKKDRIHFTREGYVMLGDLLFTALMEHYAAHLSTAQNR
ncbi:MAG TPA: GDSL-type esterase/lipase family protein [Flavobacteriales bacterium]